MLIQYNVPCIDSDGEHFDYRKQLQIENNADIDGAVDIMLLTRDEEKEHITFDGCDLITAIKACMENNRQEVRDTEWHGITI